MMPSSDDAGEIGKLLCGQKCEISFGKHERHVLPDKSCVFHGV